MAERSATPGGRIVAALLALLVAGCNAVPGRMPSTADMPDGMVPVMVTGQHGMGDFSVMVARTAATQAKGLSGAGVVKPDGGLLLAPYPPNGGAAAPARIGLGAVAVSLDIVFIRADGTIMAIVAHTAPHAAAPVVSREPVAAVLEIAGGRAAELGLRPGDRVDWPGHGARS